MGGYGKKVKVCMYLVLFENTPFLTAFELTTLAVVAPLNGVAHGGHDGYPFPPWEYSSWRE